MLQKGMAPSVHPAIRFANLTATRIVGGKRLTTESDERNIVQSRSVPANEPDRHVGTDCYLKKDLLNEDETEP